jgi:hypothetical protein
MEKLLLFATAVLVLTLGIIGCSQTPKPSSEPAQYTADQVIAIVRRQYPVCFKNNTLITASNEISVLYIGGTSRAWKATVKAPAGYNWVERSPDGGKYYTYTRKTVYFWETDKSLHASSE